MLEIIRHHKLYAKRSKCVFGTDKVEYLGHVISAMGVSTNPAKITAMSQWSVPTNLKQLRGFLGLTGYYKRFIQGYASINASGVGLGAVLLQEGHLITFLSNILSAKHQLMSTYEKEFLAIVYGLEKWRGCSLPANQELRRKGKLVVGNDQPLRTELLQQFHEGAVGGHSGVKTTMDKLSKYAHFIPLAHPFTAIDVAQVFLDNIYKLHGLPNIIISNRGKVFLSMFWKELFKLLKVKLHMSTSYHPQIDVQTEVVNRCLECYLGCMSGESKVEAVDRTLSAREEAIEVCKLADQKRTNREFQVGYWVYLKLQPHKQITVRKSKHHKLSPKFYGPFQIQDKVGQVAYRLKLPTSAQIHNIFRIFQLKKCRSPVTQCGTLPACNPNGVLLMEPVAILDRRMSKKGNVATMFMLIQWANGSKEDAT
ncbi:retrovirus-related pol polyprotein from transposon 297 family protein [Tanacetum coccineum]